MNTFDTKLLYPLALFSGIIVTLVFSILSIFTLNTIGDQYKNFNTSRNILGTTLFVWSCLLSIHFIFNLRFTDNYAAMSVSLASYFFLIKGFETTLHTLLDKHYFTRKRALQATILSGIYSLLLAVNYLIIPDRLKDISIIILTIPLCVEMCFAAYRANKRYVEVKKNIDNYYSDNTSEAVSWMRNCIYLMLSLGFSSIFIVYGSALSDAMTTLLAIAILTYMILMFNNYIAAVNNVSIAISAAQPQQNKTTPLPTTLKDGIEKWIEEHKFIVAGVTIEDLASEIKSNRTYVSDYINSQYKLTFRNWISKLRIEYSQTLMLEQPKLNIAEVAEMVGYARSSFVAVFTKEIGVPPAKWREEFTKNPKLKLNLKTNIVGGG